MRILLTTLLMFAVGPAAAVKAYRAINRLYVVPVANDTFEVIEARGQGGPGIWCAAADFVRTAGRDVPQQRIYLAKERGPSATVQGEKAVTFTLTPIEGWEQQTTYSATTRQVGASFKVSHAYMYCENFLDDFPFGGI
ncbi:MAG: hypothetical protein AAF636_07700 [Pseudomonadota bacterium]